MAQEPPFPDEAKPAPPALRLVQAFVNTRNNEDGGDLLADPEVARRWLKKTGIARRGARLGAAELARVREIRESIRALLVHNNGGPAPTAEELRPLRKLAGGRPPRLSIAADGRIDLAAPGEDLQDGLLGLLCTVRDAQEDGTWARLKACGNPECRWAFFDRSRNRQGTWCEMATCGNLIKNRQFRARHR